MARITRDYVIIPNGTVLANDGICQCEVQYCLAR